MLDSTRHFSELPEALEPLAAEDHWVLWKFEVVDNKRTKVPYAPGGTKAKTNDATTWSSYAAVIVAFNNGGYNGIGFCLRNSSVCAFDLDHCPNPETGLFHPWANTLVHERGKSYAESGEGLRIIGTGRGPRVLRKQRVDAEMSCKSYRDCEKYITISGAQLPGSANQLTDIDAVMDEVVQELDALNRRGSSDDDADAEDDDEASRGTEELPRSLAVKLHIPNLGPGVPHAGYDSRSELFLLLHHRAAARQDRRRRDQGSVSRHQVSRLRHLRALFGKRWSRLHISSDQASPHQVERKSRRGSGHDQQDPRTGSRR